LRPLAKWRQIDGRKKPQTGLIEAASGGVDRVTEKDIRVAPLGFEPPAFLNRPMKWGGNYRDERREAP